jgi:hypothetical protein
MSVYYAIAACGLFNFYNRFVSANGVKPATDEAFRRFGRRMADRGYIFAIEIRATWISIRKLHLDQSRVRLIW